MKGTLENVQKAKTIRDNVSAGCTTNINGDFCLIYEPIYADYEHDTPETIRQIDRNNLVYDEICIKT